MTTSPSSAPRLVCFDLGGVVIRICRSWREGCAAAGVPCRVDPSPGSEPSAVFDDLHRAHQVGELDGAAYARALSERLDCAYAPEEILAIHEAWLLESYADIDAIIDALHDRDVVTAALSNTNAEHWARMDDYPAVGRMMHRFASHEIGLAKPDPAIFAHVEERLGVPAAAILLLDDLEANVAAARAAGWRTARIDPDGETAPGIRAALAAQGIAGISG